MDFITSKQFDLATLALAGTSYFYRWHESKKISGSLFYGAQFFSIVNIVDRIARLTLPTNTKAQQIPLLHSVAGAVLEEIGYAGVLSTRAHLGIPFRFLVSLLTMMTAIRGYAKIPANASPPMLDVKVGFIWALARELLLQTLPESYSKPLLRGVDSALCALTEAAPLKEAPTRAYLYKTLSSLFFRMVANRVASKKGLSASITQHLFFNISRSLN